MESGFLKTTRWVGGLRGIAILGIVLYHWFDILGNPGLRFASRLGGQGVHVFFIFSSFGLALSLLNKPGAWGLWFRRRAKKVLVPYYVSILIVALAIALAAFFSGTPGKVFALTGLNRGSLLATVFLYRAAFDQYLYAINSPWWFVITIMELYIVFPLLFMGCRRYGVKFLAGALIVTLGYQIFYSLILASENRAFTKFFPAFVFEYVLGIHLAGLYRESSRKFQSYVLGRVPLMAGILFELAGIWLGMQGKWGLAVNDVFNAVGYSLIILNGCFFVYRRAFLRTALEWLGRYSMGIFLLHAPFITLLSLYIPRTPVWSFCLLVPFLSFIAVAAWFFEERILKLGIFCPGTGDRT